MPSAMSEAVDSLAMAKKVAWQALMRLPGDDFVAACREQRRHTLRAERQVPRRQRHRQAHSPA